MKCFDCNHINEKGSKFCSNCGKDFKAKKREKNNQQVFPDQNAVKIHEDKLKEKSLNPITVTVLWMLALVVAFFLGEGELISVIVATIFTLPFALMGYCARKPLKEKFYYTIPTSKDINGNHRCIFCGNRGIHKSTIYRTTTIAHTCTSCKKELFRS
jgi:hypothetical protein